MANAADLRIRITADGTQAVRGLNEVNGALQRHAQAAAAAQRHAAALRGAFMGMAQSVAAVVGLGAMAEAFIRANVESQRLVKGLTAVSGSATAGAAEMEYLSKTADKLGLSLAGAGRAYVSLTAATKGTALEGQATRDIFEAVSLAMGKLGKSSADTEGALMAVQQMVSKGVVSAEELRGQLGERLPGAFKLAAEAIGVTEQELGKLLESGDILATDLLPALSQKLNALYDDGKAVSGLEAAWNIFNNAIDRAAVAADQAAGATERLGQMLIWATGKANSFAEAMQVIANWQEGKGFAYGERDQLASDWALRAKLVDQYVAKMKEAQAYADADGVDKNFPRRAGQEADALIARINEIDARIGTTRADLKVARAEADALALRQASSMGDDAVRLYREQQAAIEENRKALDGLMGQYDKSIAQKAAYAKMEATVTEAVKLGRMTTEEAKATLAAYAAAQDKATESSRSRAKALSAEAQVVAQVEQKYGLMAGQLDAVWKLESSRGKTAGTGSERWVKDLAAGEGHMTKIVGQFQMAESTAKGLGANMATFNGQADAAGKYLAQAAAKGKTLWEQFAYYHGGPNEKSWGEKTRAYADAAVKIVADATGQMQDLGQNTGKVITDSLNKANAAVQSLIQRYLPARAAAEEYAQAQQALALASDAAGLSQEEQAIILQGLQQDLDKSKVKATETADAWAEVWKNAVKRIDDTFASLWKDLFSGTKSTLESMKNAISSWLAEVAHALLTKPLVVAITTAMTGGSSVAGAAGAAGQAASGMNGLSSITSIPSMFSTAFSLGSTFLSGMYEGMAGMFSTNMFSTLGGAMGAIGSGSSTGMAAGMGVASAYLLPLVIAGGLALSKYFKDQEPRTGAYAATTTGRTDQFEDEVGAKGGFGLTFGMNDMGTANVDAEEMRKTFEGFAAVSQALADFYGKDVEAQVQASLKKASDEHWGKNGLMNYAMDAKQAFQIAFNDILIHAAATGDELAVIMMNVGGGLEGSLEEMATQIERKMQAAKLALSMSESMKGQEMGDRLGLGDDNIANATRLANFAHGMKEADESTAEALAHMALNLSVFDAALTLTGSATDTSGQAFLDLAYGLENAADKAKVGMQGLMQLQAAYYDHFYTEEEKALKQKENALQAIAKWNEDAGRTGDAAITTSAAFRTYVESLDLTTAAGQTAYVEAMKMVGGFISLDDALKKLGDTVPDLVDKFEAQRKAMRDLADQLDPTDPLSQSQRDAALAALQKAGYQGSLYDAKGIAAFLRALADLDDAGGEAGAELQKFIDTFTGVFDELARIAEERAGLEMRLLELTGTDAEILAAKRRLEMAATDESNRAILARIYQLEDEAAALAKAKAAAEERTNLLIRLADAQGNAPLATYLRRQIELAAAMNDTNRAILLQIYAIEDAEAARRDAEAARRAAYDAEAQAAEEYNAAAQKAADEANDAARAALQSLQDAAEAAYQTADAIANAWIEALSAAGLEAEATALSRRLQAAAMDPALRSVYTIVWQIQDAAERAAAQGDLAIQALGYLDRDKDAIAATRRLQRAATDPALRAMQDWVWKLEDAREAADKAGEAIQTLIDGLQAVSGALDDTIKSVTDLINGSSPAALAQTRQAAQRDLAAQLAAAQAGTMPTTESLEETLATLSKDPAGQFGDRTAYLRDLGRTRGQLASLKGIVDKQIPIEEQNLEALKNLPTALYPNFEAIVASIGTSSTGTGNLISQATAAVNAAIAAMQARDDAMDQSIKDIVPALKEIPPYIENVETKLVPLQTLAADMAANLGAIDLNIDGMVSYDEFAAFFGNIMSDADMKAYFGIFDSNGDGMIDRLELIKANTAPLLTIVDNLANKFSTIDLSVDGTVTWDEFSAFFGKIADKDQLAIWFNAIDTNGDGVISELEAMQAQLNPLAGLASSIVQGMAEIDLNVDGMVSYDEFTALFGGLASDTEMAAWFAKLDLNGDGILDQVELIKGSLNITQSLAKLISDNLKAIDTDLDGLVSYEEYATFFGDLATEAELKAGFAMLDKNEDGILSKLEQQYITLGAMGTKIADEMEKVDLNVNGTVEYSEFATFFDGLAAKEEMQAWFDRLDADQDGLLSEAELTNAKLNNQVVNGDSLTSLLTSIRDYIGPPEGGRGVNGILIDLKNTLFNGGGGYSGIGDYLAAGKNYAATANDYLKTSNDLAGAVASTLATASERLGALESGRGVNGILIDLKNTLFNGGGDYSGLGVYLAAITTTLDTIATNTGGNAPPDSSGTLTNILSAINTGNGHLNNIKTSASSTVSQLGTSGVIYTVLIDTKNTLFNGGGGYSGIGVYLAAMRNNLKRLVDAGAGVGGGYATGGIASGPTSGYQATLHGTEAIIPLGDGNSVTAHLTSPLPPAPNLIYREAGDSQGLRQALAELQAEVQALRSDQQAAAAATVGELRDHNRRERKRDVVGQKVEVVS